MATACPSSHREGQVHPGNQPGVFQGVAQQILEHPVEAVTVPWMSTEWSGELSAQLQPALLDGLVHIRQGLAEQAGQVQPFEAHRQLAGRPPCSPRTHPAPSPSAAGPFGRGWSHTSGQGAPDVPAPAARHN